MKSMKLDKKEFMKSFLCCSAFIFAGCATDQSVKPIVVGLPQNQATISRNPIECGKPEYPRESIAAKESGMVELALYISKEGNVLKTLIRVSSGYPRLDEVTVDALSRCKFKPAILNGEPTEAWTKLKYVWKLD